MIARIHGLANRLLLYCLVALLPLLCPYPAQADAPTQKPQPVKLAVIVIFDQLRGDYLTRWDRLFGEGGFHRLEKEGAWFQNCRYPYGFTVTAAGHASIVTGTSPDKHGIILNEWYDIKEDMLVYSSASTRYEQVPAREGDDELGGSEKKARGVTPERLLSPTLGDTLKESTGGKGRVFSISFKDRSAAMLGGRRPDACYWVDSSSGAFVTSNYYRDAVHSWVKAFNTGHPADAWFGRDWTRLRADLDYERYSGPDDVEGEAKGARQGRTFPHPTTGGLKKPGKDYYLALENTPFGNDYLLGFVKKAIDAEKLGRGEAPDLLCISFSSNDLVGHCFGPDSQEVLDITLRSDLIMKELLDYLDTKVGKGQYLLALSADHGVCPLPEVARKQGKDSGRISSSLLVRHANDFLAETFGNAGDNETVWVERESGGYYLYLNPQALEKYKLKPAKVEAALARWLLKQDGIQAAYTRTQLMGEKFKDDPIGQMMKRSFYAERAGDVAIVPKPYHIVFSTLAGTTHGTPHSYDTHVPLLVYGPGLRSGVREDRVTPQAIAAILARGLGVKPPADADAPVPKDLYREAK